MNKGMKEKQGSMVELLLGTIIVQILGIIFNNNIRLQERRLY